MTDITGILEAVIALIGVIITCVIIPYLKTKTTAMQREKAQAWIDIGVSAAEQIFKTTGLGKKKKEYVINFLKSKGITYDEATIDALIEASVKSLNIAQGDVKIPEKVVANIPTVFVEGTIADCESITTCSPNDGTYISKE